MGEGIVMRHAEDADALLEHQFRKRLVGLPLGGLLPDGLSVAHGQVEACADGLRRHMAVARGIGVAHIVEGVSYLVGHSMTDGLAG